MTYQEQRDAIRRDLDGKLFREDWHGVMDCAADLRELDAYQRGLFKEKPPEKPQRTFQSVNVKGDRHTCVCGHSYHKHRTDSTIPNTPGINEDGSDVQELCP